MDQRRLHAWFEFFAMNGREHQIAWFLDVTHALAPEHPDVLRWRARQGASTRDR